MFNPAIARLTAPPVAIVQNWIDQYQGDHGPLIDMSQAVPGYPAHADLLAALGQHGASKDSLGYGAIEGEAALRQAYADHMTSLYGASVDTEEVLITAGCNQAFITAAMAVAGAGDQVLMTRPNYFNHDSTLEMMGVTTGFVETSAEDGFIPDIAAIEAAITPQTRALALVSPNNPTGAIYPPERLDEIAACCLKHNIWLILDETYRDFLPQQNGGHTRHMICCDHQRGGGSFCSIVFLNPMPFPGTGWVRLSPPRKRLSRWPRSWTTSRSAPRVQRSVPLPK